MEREVLWGIAPHIIWPLRFVLPHHRGLRPAWLLRLGLFLYDHLGGRTLCRRPGSLDLARDARRCAAEAGLRAGLRVFRLLGGGFAPGGAERARCRRSRRRRSARARAASPPSGPAAVARSRSEADGGRRDNPRRALVNAAGPWVAEVLGGVVRANAPAKVRLVQGSHIVVPRMFDHDRCYIFQNADGRIVFAIPYERDFTLIGTTDQDYCRRSRRRRGERGRDRISVRRRQRVFPQARDAGRTWSGPIRACARSMTTARPRRRRRRATTC